MPTYKHPSTTPVTMPGARELIALQYSNHHGRDLARRIIASAPGSMQYAREDLIALGLDTVADARRLTAKATPLLAAIDTCDPEFIMTVHDAWAQAAIHTALQRFGEWINEGHRQNPDLPATERWKLIRQRIDTSLKSLATFAYLDAHGTDSGYYPDDITEGQAPNGEKHAQDTNWSGFPNRHHPTFRARRIIALTLRIPGINPAEYILEKKRPGKPSGRLWQEVQQMVESDLMRKIMADSSTRVLSSRLDLRMPAVEKSSILGWAREMADPVYRSKLRDAQARAEKRALVDFDLYDQPLDKDAPRTGEGFRDGYVGATSLAAELAVSRAEERIEGQVQQLPEKTKSNSARTIHVGAAEFRRAFHLPPATINPDDQEQVRAMLEEDPTLAHRSLKAALDLRNGCPTYDQMAIPSVALSMWDDYSNTLANRTLGRAQGVAHAIALAAALPMGWLSSRKVRAELTLFTLEASTHPDWSLLVPGAVEAWSKYARGLASANVEENWREMEHRLVDFPGCPLGEDPHAFFSNVAPYLGREELAELAPDKELALKVHEQVN